MAPLLLRAGHLARDPEADAELRPAARHHQPADRQRSRATAGSSTSARGRSCVGGVGGIALDGNVKNKLTGRRASARRTSSTRRRCCAPGSAAATTSACSGRSSGTAVTQNLPVLAVQDINAPNNFDACSIWRRGRRRRTSRPSRPTAGSRCRTGLRPRAARQAAAAHGGCVQRHRPASAQRTRCRSRSATSATAAATCSSATAPPPTSTSRSIVGFANGVSTNQRRPFFAGNVANAQGFGGAYGWTQGIDFFCNCATNRYNSLQAKVDEAVLAGLFADRALHAAALGATTTATTSSSIPT